MPPEQIRNRSGIDHSRPRIDLSAPSPAGTKSTVGHKKYTIASFLGAVECEEQKEIIVYSESLAAVGAAVGAATSSSELLLNALNVV